MMLLPNSSYCPLSFVFPLGDLTSGRPRIQDVQYTDLVGGLLVMIVGPSTIVRFGTKYPFS